MPIWATLHLSSSQAPLISSRYHCPADSRQGRKAKDLSIVICAVQADVVNYFSHDCLKQALVRLREVTHVLEGFDRDL
jgi:hypothetical protein